MQELARERHKMKPVETKIYAFKTEKSKKLDLLVKTSEYFSCKGLGKQAGASQIPEDKSLDRIVNFLNIGKAEFDQLKSGFKKKTAAVVDINRTTNIPMNLSKKKNKNDFYRFLLGQSATYSGV